MVELPEDANAQEVMERYADWALRDVGDWCVSPGLVDCNVCVNGEWDGVESVSRAAVSGGVTFFLAEPSLYHQEIDFSQPLYCDVGKTALIGGTSAEDGKSQLHGAFALKAYMFPPSAYVSGVAQQLDRVLRIAQEEDVPLILDVSYPSPRMLYMASPCRLMSLEERMNTSHFSDDKFFAGAFPEEIDPQSISGSSSSSSFDSSLDEDRDFSPKPFKSGFTSPVVNAAGSEFERASLGFSVGSTKNLHTVKSFEVGKKQEGARFLRVPTMVNVSTRRRSFQCRTIYEDLQRRIEASQGNIENLSKVELMAYVDAGETKFGLSAGRKRSNSITDISPKLEVLQEERFKHPPNVSEFSVSDKRKDRFQRPAGLEITKGATPESSKDRQYIYHIANHPDHWETNGVAVAKKAIAV